MPVLEPESLEREELGFAQATLILGPSIDSGRNLPSERPTASSSEQNVARKRRRGTHNSFCSRSDQARRGASCSTTNLPTGFGRP